MGYSRILAVAPLLIAVYGCSSSSSDSSAPGGGTPTPPPTTSGLFVDVEVKGMGFATASVSGVTDQYGVYDYAAGEDITFSIGGVTLGTLPGAPGITPFDFGTGDAILNIARFIQSLDADDDPTNGIDLTAAAAALAGTTIGADAFQVDTATFEANTAISDALTLAGKTLIAAGTAQINLNNGTDSTFDAAELADKAFVLIDHVSGAVGIISFGASDVFSILSTDTTSAGEDGLGGDDSWSVASGVLTIEDVAGGSTTTVNRIGSSTEGIAFTVSEDGSPLLPGTFVFPEPVTNADLGGDGNTVTSKTYDVVDQDGTLISVTFSYDGISDAGSYVISGTGETGPFQANLAAPGVITLGDDLDQTDITFMIIMDGDASVIDGTATILLAAGTIVSGDLSNPDVIVFNEIGLGSVTLKSVTP